MRTREFPDDNAVAAAASADRELEVLPPDRRIPPLKPPKRGPDKQPRRRHRTGQLTLKLKPEEAATTPPATPPPEADYVGDGAEVPKRKDPGPFLQSVPQSIDELQWRRDALRLPGVRRAFHMVVVYRWLPLLPDKEAPGIWHLRHALEDDGMLEAEVCLEMLTGSYHLRSPADSTTYFGCLTRSIARLRREIDTIGAAAAGNNGSGSGPPAMLSDGAIITAYVLGISSSAPSEEMTITSDTGLFADPLFSFYDHRFGGRLQAFFESTHFAHVRRMALHNLDGDLVDAEAASGGKKRATRLPVLLSHMMLLHASYKLIPPGFAYPEEQLRAAARGFNAYPDHAALATDALLAAEPDFLLAVRCLRVLCRRRSEAGDGETTGYTSMRTYVALVQHHLLSVRRADPAIEVYRLGALVFAYGVVGYVVAPLCLRLLVEHLVEALRAPRYTEGQPPALLFWAAVLGAVASAPRPGAVLDRTDPATVHYLRRSYYLVGEVKRLAQVLGLGSWEEAEGVLKDFVWTGTVCNTGAMYIWDLAQTRSERGRLIGL